MGDDLASVDEALLIRRSQEGDTRTFDELITRYREKIYMLALQIVRNEDDALDLTQETFIRAWRSLSRLKVDNRFSLSNWLRRIVTNAAIDLYRKRQHRPQVEIEDYNMKIDPASQTTPSAGDLPGASVDRKIIRRRLAEAMEKLSPEHRAVVVLKEIEDLTYEEIARTMNCSIGTVMSRLFYARKKLQQLLGDFYEKT